MSPDLPRALRCVAFLLVRASAPLLPSLKQVAADCPDPALAEALEIAAHALRDGATLDEAVAGWDLPPLGRRALARGAESGDLAPALRFAARLASWETASPGDARRALRSLQGSLSCGLPLSEALDPDAFVNPASREQASAFLTALADGDEAPFAQASRLFPMPWGAVLDHAAPAGVLPDALDELIAHLDARRVWLAGPGGAHATELAGVLRFLAWAVRFGQTYPAALELAASLPDEPLAGYVREGANRRSLANALEDADYPAALVHTIRRAAEDDGDLPRTFRALADALDQGLFPL